MKGGVQVMIKRNSWHMCERAHPIPPPFPESGTFFAKQRTDVGWIFKPIHYSGGGVQE